MKTAKILLKTSILLGLLLLLDSCVSKSKYEAVVFSRDSLNLVVDSLQKSVADLNESLRIKNLEIEDYQQKLQDKVNELSNANENYNVLKSKSSSETQDLLAKIETLQNDKIKLENELGRANSKISELKNDKSNLGEELKELKRLLAERDSKMVALKNKIADALLGFRDKGLSVNVKDGKVYVSLSNQLLFSSGSTKIDEIGKNALKDLASVLNENPDIFILVEGHTDDQAVAGGNRFKDNWELSVLRATEVVKYLQEDGNVEPARLTASGRGEYKPVEAGSTPEIRAKNRRIEVILTPNLEEIFEVIK